MGGVPAADPTLPLAQARARWGAGLVVAGLFRPGPDPQARTALGKAVTRQTNRRRSHLPGRLLVGIDDAGSAYICPVVADPQGGHPDGDDLFAGPFEELGAVAAGELSVVVLLDDSRPAVLEAAWLDRDAAAVVALLTGDPLPDELEQMGAGGGDEDEDEDDDEPSPAELLAEADAIQAKANSLRAIAAARLEQEDEDERERRRR